MSKRALALIMSLLLVLLTGPVCSAENSAMTFQAENSITNSKITTTTASNITYVSVSETGYVTYTVNVSKSAYYSVNVRASGAYQAYFNLSLNSVPLIGMSTRKTNGVTRFDDNFALVYLPEGENTLKISATKEVLNFDYITLTPLDVTKADYDSFLTSINSCKNYKSYESVISNYASDFNINFSDLTKNIFYKLPIYEELSNRKYNDLNDAINDIYDVAKKYQSSGNQPVIAYKDRTPITALQSGNLSYYVKTAKLKAPTTVVCAIYKNNALYKMNFGTFTSGTQIIIPIDGVEITTEDDFEFKLIYIEDFETISSVNLYGKIYKEIYVSPNGNDNNTGSKQSPFKTISAAKNYVAQNNLNMSGDIVVNIAPGDYYLPETEKITSAHSGKNGYNVIFKGTDKENPPLIHGGIKIDSWSEYKNGIYKAPLSGVSDVRNLYVDGFNAVRARSENSYRNEAFYGDPATDSERDGYKILLRRIPHRFNNPKGLETVWEIGWCAQRVPVSEVFTEGDYMILKSTAYEALNKNISTETININQYKYFYLENALELLDKPGEFFYDKDEKFIYYYPNEGETFDNIYVPSTEGLFEIGSKEENAKTENIVFDNLDIRYGAWNEVSEVGMIATQADSIQNLKNPGTSKMVHSQFVVNNASGIKIRNCNFSCLGSGAIGMIDNVSDSEICGNAIHDISGTGIVIGTWEHTLKAEGLKMCTNIDVKNNLLRRTSQEYRGTTAIAVYYENSIDISHNDISDVPYTGITAGWGWGANIYTAGNFTISKNKVTDVMNCLYDGSNIYTLGPLKESAIFENYLDDSKYVISGIYTDSGSSLLKMFENVILDDDEDSIWWYQGHNNTKDLHAYKNYTMSENIRVATESNNIEENTVHITRDSIPQRAQEIIDNAGLENEYVHLLEKAPLGQNKTNIAKTTPKIPYASGAYRYASEYDRSYDPTTGNVPIPSKEYVSFNRNEWVEYDIEVKEAGTYNLLIAAAYGWKPTKEGEVIPNSTVSVYLDGTLKFNGNVSPTDSWSAYNEFELGKLDLKAGVNTIRIKNVNKHGYGFHLSGIILEK